MCGWPVILFHAYTLHADEYLEEDSDDDFTYEEVGLTDWMHPMQKHDCTGYWISPPT